MSTAAELQDAARRRYLFANWPRDASRNERAHDDALAFWRAQLVAHARRAGALCVDVARLRAAFAHADGDAPSDAMLGYLLQRLCAPSAASASTTTTGDATPLLTPRTFLQQRADALATRAARGAKT